ncbi:Trafficking protein particle complex subunit-like protein [Emericellopsis cladophorae]|uniref:Trafficking protein particle complex subunit-like protein n=1 Tax=Emericellopsis cladophorae TaxID=2686198 RepID=A0A9Q0B9I3_9HYPO|nr:Trafficking protein particle complex subunit-like protein [Emericellopsis cladophorae]KAI6777877.1 Trafficking protein particle complex subunit-like protein [Emericellopsis cladophorae]
METEQDAQRAWEDLLHRLKDLILVSFDRRVSQYEDDIKEKESQRALPGWNFCTFFILKEGLARGFESVGLVDDALVGYDELSVGLESFVAEQNAGGNLGRQGGGLLQYTESLKQTIDAFALDSSSRDDETVDLQSDALHKESADEIPINAARRPYRDMILANDVSAFDFRCYLFSRQITLLLRLANAQSTREELLAQLKEQQDSILYGVAPRVPTQQKKPEEKENLAKLAEICHRALEFIPQISHVMRQELLTAYAEEQQKERTATSLRDDVINNIVSSFGFSVAQQILAQTSTKALPIPSSTISFASDDEQKASIPEPKTMMHPARESSLHIKTPQQEHQPPPSPGVFPGPGQHPITHHGDSYEAYLAKNGLEELAAKRGDLYMFSRSILTNFGKPRGWSAGWDEAPIMHELGMLEMVDINLNDDGGDTTDKQGKSARDSRDLPLAGINSKLLRTAADNSTDFYRLYEILTDKALRHFTVAGLEQSIQGAMSDLAVLKYHLQEYRAATSFFCLTTPFFGESGWTWLELSMLVMYTKCLKHLKSKEFVRVALKLLTKACATQKDHQKPGTLAGSVCDGSVRAGISAVVNDAVGNISELALALPGDAKVPLDSFVTNVCLESMPVYHCDRDSATMSMRLQSLLPNEVTFDSVTLQLVTDNVAHTEVIFRAAEQTLIVPGPNVITLHCSSIIPGLFRVGKVCLQSSHLSLSSDYDTSSSKPSAHRIRSVLLHRPASALHVALSASRHMTLNKTNHLELTVHTGNNSIKSCEVRIRPATGGLRMLMNEAVCVGQPDCFAKPPEAGVFRLGALPRDSPTIIQFPYTIEQDVAEIVAKLDVSYHTDQDGPFATSETSKIPISLAVGVNVQDIFKHSFMYSRFSVSTGSTQPLRLYDSELLDSGIFEATRSGLASSTLDIFPDHPTTLVYKVQRKSIGEHRVAPNPPDVAFALV